MLSIIFWKAIHPGFYVITALIILAQVQRTSAQAVLFQETFEVGPVTSVLNTFGDTVQDGASPCGQASRGTTSDFNSLNVDYQNAQNSTSFLGLNPEAPCGGAYNASLYSDTMDWSGFDSLIFSCDYFKSTTLGWGATELEIIFNSSMGTDTIGAKLLSDTNNWGNVQVKLATSIIDSFVSIRINLGGGEGVGLDNILVNGYSPGAGVKSPQGEFAKVFPNPVSDYLHIETYAQSAVSHMDLFDAYGRRLITKRLSNKVYSFGMHKYPPGIYLIYLHDGLGGSMSFKLLKD